MNWFVKHAHRAKAQANDRRAQRYAHRRALVERANLPRGYTEMRPMFSYFGSKWNLAKRYGPPKYDIVIEPWNAPRALLIDKNPEIIGIWQYLIKVKEREILKLPIDFDHVDDLCISQEAKWLIGYWIKKASASAGKSRTAWGRKYRNSKDCKVWNECVRERIASQLYKIRKWRAKLGNYHDFYTNVEATWFIDPPYMSAGHGYKFSEIDYAALAKFCKSRDGQVFVCENDEASWMKFKPLYSARGTFGLGRTGVTHEVVWIK